MVLKIWNIERCLKIFKWFAEGYKNIERYNPSGTSNILIVFGDMIAE